MVLFFAIRVINTKIGKREFDMKTPVNSPFSKERQLFIDLDKRK